MLIALYSSCGGVVRFAGASRRQEVDAILARFLIQPYDTTQAPATNFPKDNTFAEDRIGATDINIRSNYIIDS